MPNDLRAPFPWHGGKSRAAPLVWPAFQGVVNYVEPCCGSAAMLLARPGGASGTETVNDLDGLLINAYRAIVSAPEETAAWCDWPVSEADLTSRHLWLKGQRQELTARLFGDPLYCDPQAAGWWLWGIASWIGDGWCVADGPWISVDGRLVDRREAGRGEAGVGKQIPAVSDKQGYERMNGIQAYRAGVPRKMPIVSVSDVKGGGYAFDQGVQYQRRGTPSALLDYFLRLQERLRRVRFLCGDWQRVVKPSITTNHGLTAVFLDPEYPPHEHSMTYHQEEQGQQHIWYACQAWALAHGDDPKLRIALCGYQSAETDALFPASWRRVSWQALGGYGNQGQGRGRANARRECIWLSPHCGAPAGVEQSTLFDGKDSNHADLS